MGSNVATGAAIGAVVFSVFGPFGTVFGSFVGAALGGGAGLLYTGGKNINCEIEAMFTTTTTTTTTTTPTPAPIIATRIGEKVAINGPDLSMELGRFILKFDKEHFAEWGCNPASNEDPDDTCRAIFPVGYNKDDKIWNCYCEVWTFDDSPDMGNSEDTFEYHYNRLKKWIAKNH
ncbi:hypothetical protein niasHT_003251 [Heterodera trifolii]|uniref:Uncharacterized protein n=1 Tax=Heterodera trifolii TaxID=157864 RepID=A0ABD2LTU4_9BILA